MYGKGCLKFANGDIYNGEWKKGIKDGWGEYTFADGSVKVRENCNHGFLNFRRNAFLFTSNSKEIMAFGFPYNLSTRQQTWIGYSESSS